MWTGYRSRYSDWLRAGRSGDRNPVGAKFSTPVQTGPGTHPVSCKMGTESFPGVKSGRSVKMTPHPFLCHGQERVELYLYSPYGPYGLYRASVPEYGCILPFLSCVWSELCIVTMLRTGRPRNLGSIPVRGIKLPYMKITSQIHPVPRLRMNETSFPLSHAPCISCSGSNLASLYSMFLI